MDLLPPRGLGGTAATFQRCSTPVDHEGAANPRIPHKSPGSSPLCPTPPQIEIGTLAPPDYSYPEASLEEEQEVLEHEEEMPLKPQHAPQGSGDSGVLMGPGTQKGQNEHAP